MYLTPEPALLFKRKSDIVFCVTRATLFSALPLPGGWGLSQSSRGGAGGGGPRLLAKKLGGGAAGRKSRPGSDGAWGDGGA